MTPHDPQDSFRNTPPQGDEWRDYWRLRHQWEESGWIVPILADLATSARRLAIIAATFGALGAAITWAIKQGWFQ